MSRATNTITPAKSNNMETHNDSLETVPFKNGVIFGIDMLDFWVVSTFTMKIHRSHICHNFMDPILHGSYVEFLAYTVYHV